MQQMRPKEQKPLGLPPEREHDIADEQVPESPLEVVQLSTDENGHT